MKAVLIVLMVLLVLAVPMFATKQIIVLKQSTNGSSVCYQTANWYVITTGQQSGSTGSQWTGASTAENTAIQTGSVLEEISSNCFPVGQDVTSIKAVLLKQWTVRNSQIGGIGPGQYNSVFYDSATGWSQ